MILLVRWECIIFVASIHTQSWKRATASGNGDEHAADYITQKYTHTQRMWWWVIGAMMPAFDAEQCRLWPVCASHNELNHYISVFTLPNPAASSLFLIKSFSDQTSSFLTLWPFLLYYFVAIVAVCVCVCDSKNGVKCMRTSRRIQLHEERSLFWAMCRYTRCLDPIGLRKWICINEHLVIIVIKCAEQSLFLYNKFEYDNNNNNNNMRISFGLDIFGYCYGHGTTERSISNIVAHTPPSSNGMLVCRRAWTCHKRFKPICQHHRRRREIERLSNWATNEHLNSNGWIYVWMLYA